MQDILTVTQLNEDIKGLLEGHFDQLWVEGEVSNLRRPSSGHLYFTLKDDRSQIRAVVFRHPFAAGRKVLAVEEGLHVVCRARLGVYQPRGEYQLIIDTIEPLGVGALQKAFEQLKAKLASEGLFDPSRKRAIPFLPARIGVITSPTGAVIRDIIHVTGRRFPSQDILIAPVRVQGPEAPAEIIRALSDLQSSERVDTIILARGGGSLEDLAPFNDEAVARAIARCRIPVISAVGHETDYTIADFVADLRAPTPSAAAEMAVPVRSELQTQIRSALLRMINHHRRFIKGLRDQTSGLEKRLRSPERLMADWRIAIDECMGRLQSQFANGRSRHVQSLDHLQARLQAANPLLKVRSARVSLASEIASMVKGWQACHGRWKSRTETGMTLLDSLSPLAVLKRGYSITRSLPEGLIVKNASVLQTGSEVDVRLASGSLHATVKNIFRE